WPFGAVGVVLPGVPVRRWSPVTGNVVAPPFCVRTWLDDEPLARAAGVNHGCLHIFPTGRYSTTAGTPAARSFASRPAASVSESICTVTDPSAFLVTAYAACVPAVRTDTPVMAAAANAAATPPARATPGTRPPR